MGEILINNLKKGKDYILFIFNLLIKKILNGRSISKRRVRNNFKKRTK